MKILNLFMIFCESVRKFISTKKEICTSYLAIVHGSLKVRVLCIALLLMPIMLVTFFIIILPLLSSNNEKLNVKKPLPNDSARIELLSAYNSLRLEKSFLSSQIALSNKDSIGLIVDLQDSLVKLTIRGCVIHECLLSRFSFRSGYRNLVKAEYKPLYSGKPLRLKRELASIEKLPIKIKKAPTDTLEAQNRTDDAPGPLEIHDVRIQYEFEENVTIELVQKESFTFKDIPARLIYSARSNMNYVAEALKFYVNSEKSERNFTIRIFIPQKDAIAIYRATPGMLYMAFRF